MSTTRALAVLLTAGCTAGTGGPYVPPDPTDACASLGAGWTPATQTQLTFSTLIVNGQAVIPDIATFQACLPDDGSPGAAWLFGAQGGEYGVITSDAAVQGPQQLPSADLTVDLYAASPPITFAGTDFVQGNWVVNGLNPYSMSLQDASATTSNGHIIAIALTASATP